MKPKVTPIINGRVFLIPKLKPEYEATALFGPGVKPMIQKFQLSKIIISGCI